MIGSRSWHLQGVSEGQVRVLDDLDLTLDGKMLASLTEGTRAIATFTAKRQIGGEENLAELRRDIRILAPNEWGGSGGIPDILAAFVEPNDPAVGKLLRLTSDHLRTAGKPDGLEGYQVTNKARIWEQVEALWRAIGSLDIRYVNPAPSFEQTGQKIRPPSQIVSERLATCLDLAVLFAACIEAIGLRPVIVLTRDHAIAGFWLTRHDFGSSVADDAPGLRTRLALHDLLLFETTLICGRGRSGFKRACEEGEAHVVSDKDGAFEAVIDVHRARQRRIRPLSSNGGGYAFKIDISEEPAEVVDLQYEEPPPLREDPQTEEDEPPNSPDSRLERWRKRLLDLSGRNRLLNLPMGGKQALSIDCPDPAQLENILADMRSRAKAQPLRFRPWPDLMTGNDPRSAKIHRARLQDNADRAYATEALARRELVVGRDDANLQATLTEIFRAARAARQEGDTTPVPDNRRTPVASERKGKALSRAHYVSASCAGATQYSLGLLPAGARRQQPDQRHTARDAQAGVRHPLSIARGRPSASGQFRLDVPLILDTFRAKLRDIPQWEVTNEVTLTNLSVTKYLMWKDLVDRADALRQSELARRLMEGRIAGAEDTFSAGRDNKEQAGGPIDLDEVAADLACPLEADSSQLQAVATARVGKSFILIGPPGTGKSQTIANIIADTLSRAARFCSSRKSAQPSRLCSGVCGKSVSGTSASICFPPKQARRWSSSR